MMSDKQYLSPIRIVVSGNDNQFNDFVKVYVDKILQLKPILLKDQKRQQGPLIFDESDNGNPRMSTNGSFRPNV